MRTAIVRPGPSRRSGSPAAAGRTRVSGPGQNSPARAVKGGGRAAVISPTMSRSETMTESGFERVPPLQPVDPVRRACLGERGRPQGVEGLGRIGGHRPRRAGTRRSRPELQGRPSAAGSGREDAGFGHGRLSPAGDVSGPVSKCQTVPATAPEDT
ncbi:MAG: hypothetical protein MZV64_22700 [Ignavibacteriales bacterium]|nr:hypothetical protein [Ignavibacteriales bacterium]